MTITEFLQARIEEDEAAAKACEPGDWHIIAEGDAPLWVSGLSIHAADSNWDACIAVADALHVVRHNPARVLAECAAKRAIIGEHGAREVASLDRGTWGQVFIVCRVCAIGSRQVVAPCPTIKTLTAVYSDHKDFQEEWAA